MRYYVNSIVWADGHAFRTEPLQPLKWQSPDREPVTWGYTKSFGLLYYAEIEGGGHMIPLDKPRETLEVINCFIFGTKVCNSIWRR